MVVSDHGMTENGNHGGASYEETDALMLLIGLGDYDHRPTTHKIVNQVCTSYVYLSYMVSKYLLKDLDRIYACRSGKKCASHALFVYMSCIACN